MSSFFFNNEKPGSQIQLLLHNGGVDGIWPPSGHEEVPGLNDGVEFSTRSAQERVFDGAKDILFVSIGGGKTIFSLVVIIFWLHGFLPVPSGSPPDPEFPHFSNVPSGTAGGFFKARRRGNPHNVLPGTVQGRSQGGFLDMNESPLPSHPLPRPQPLGRFRQNVPQSVASDARNSSATYPTPQGPFHCPNSIPRGRGYRVY
ncbi:hypothetical protein TNCT_595471 [Trichonephila clavata]|uniref:Uncharacterized protein n=1 Tax=Trichonephila clavata TaxID=2740835 RepID=A0A8X6FHG6_TRICU|nr:hypothetical protein TNCT_595471 [Trichonephila clavata]